MRRNNASSLCSMCQACRAHLRRPKTGARVCRDCFCAALEREVHETITAGVQLPMTNVHTSEHTCDRPSTGQEDGAYIRPDHKPAAASTGTHKRENRMPPVDAGGGESQEPLFKRGERVAIAVSGGKDSTVLAQILTTLNERYSYGLDLVLLAVDEGIRGYRDDSLERVKANEEEFGIPLKVVSYEDLYGGWSMDKVVSAVGRSSNCTFCGVLRRQALDRGAALLQCDKIATGHNADDVAETVLLNVLRGDTKRLGRCTNITTGRQRNELGHSEAKQHTQDDDNNCNDDDDDEEEEEEEEEKDTFKCLPRCKPLKYTYEKEIVMYAHFKKLNYFSTECIYAPGAFRGFAREFVKDLEAIRPSSIADIITSGESIRVNEIAASQQEGRCVQCGYMSSQKVCKACLLIEGLNKGKPKMGLEKQRKNVVSESID